MIIAAQILVVIQLSVAIFQGTLVLGSPLGEYTLGGQNKGKLPTKLRIASFISMLINLGIGGHYYAQSGALTPLLTKDLNEIVNWALVGFNSIGLVMNAISRSKKERNLWVPVLIVSLICAILVAAGVAMNNAA
jgi:uncharacterized membrane protein